MGPHLLAHRPASGCQQLRRGISRLVCHRIRRTEKGTAHTDEGRVAQMAKKKPARSAYRVQFDFSESAFKFKPTYDSLAAFDADLQKAALLAPRSGAYDKT